jgi:hypothetical protein
VGKYLTFSYHGEEVNGTAVVSNTRNTRLKINDKPGTRPAIIPYMVSSHGRED